MAREPTGGREAFDEELERAFAMIRSLPDAGQPVEDPAHPGLRRLFLGRLRYHLYYLHSSEVVDVVALWHASRGRGPEI